MWADNETTNDLIGFRVHSDLIRHVVTNPKLLPVSIGVFGDWGGGKTSIMRMLEHDLNPKNWPDGVPERAAYEKIACVYFNGWLFEGYDDAKAAIISSILLQLKSHHTFGTKVGKSIEKLLRSVNWMRILSFGLKQVAFPGVTAALTGGVGFLPTFVGAGASLLPKPAAGREDAKGADTDKTETPNLESFIKDSTDKDDPFGKVRQFRDEFEALLKEAGIESLVVLVDDLDRCSPERIVENLEAVKLFLNVERTAFVIGADPRIVKHAIAFRYGKQGMDSEDERRQLVQDYLEKLIQVPYHLPKLSPSEVETYMTLLFCVRHLSDDQSRLCLNACNERRAANRFFTFRFGDVQLAVGPDNVTKELGESLTFCSLSAPLITDGLKGNPRQVKRFLNALILRKQLAEVARLSDIRDDVLVKLMILEYVNQERFAELYQWQAGQDGKPEQLSKLEQAEDADASSIEKIAKGWGTKVLVRWLEMEPALAEVDLRNYFWIARDRLESTLSGTTMIPPAVQKALTGILSDSRGENNEAVELAKTLNPEEREVFFRALAREFSRKPNASHAGILALLNARVEGTASFLATALKDVPVTSLEPSFALRLETAIDNYPEAKEVLQPAVQSLKQSGSKAGRAMRGEKAR